MEGENTDKKLKNYISTAIKSGVSQESIVETLLSKGWLVSEIKNEFAVNGSAIDGDFAAVGTRKRKAVFAISSVALFVLALLLYFADQLILSALLSFSGLVLGAIGVKSKKKAYAIIGIILNLLALAWIVLAIGVVVYMVKTGKFPITGEPLTEQQEIEFGINEIRGKEQ